MLFRRRYVFRGYRFIPEIVGSNIIFPLLYCDFLMVKRDIREYYIVFRAEDESRIKTAVDGLNRYLDMHPAGIENIYSFIYGRSLSAIGLRTPLYVEICPKLGFFAGLFIRKHAIHLGRELDKRIVRYSKYGIDVGAEKTEIMKRLASLKQTGICFQHTILIDGGRLKEKDIMKVLGFKPLKKWYITPLDLEIFLRKNIGAGYEDISWKAWRHRL